MSWLAQVRHVLAKDVVESRRLLALYVVLVVVATWRATGWTLLSHGLLGSVTLLVVVAGLFLIATVVQADSPSRSDAFWATHPLRPSAVAGAKVGFTLLLLAIGLVGQAIAVRSFDVQGVALLSLVAPAIPAYGVVLVAAMVVAALVRDLRSFALMLVLFLVAFNILMGLLASTGPRLVAGAAASGPEPGGLLATLGLAPYRVVGVLGALGLLAWLYRTRDARLRTRVAGFAIVMFGLVTSAAGDTRVIEKEGGTVEALPLTLEPVYGDGRLRTSEGELHVNVRAAAIPSDMSPVLAHSVLVVRLRDGSELRLPTSDPYATMDIMSDRPLPRLDGVRWIGSPPIADRVRTINVPISPAQARAIDGGVAHLTLEGQVIVVGARVRATMPLTDVRRLASPGLRVGIEEWSHESGAPSLRLRVSSIEVDQARPALSWPGGMGPGLMAALVSPARGEALPLQYQGGGSGMDGLVLPGTPYQSSTMSFTARQGRSAPRSPEAPPEPTLDDAWFRDAHLLLASPVVLGSYPVRLELEVP